MSCPVCGAPIVRYEDNGEVTCSEDAAHLEDIGHCSNCRYGRIPQANAACVEARVCTKCLDR